MKNIRIPIVKFPLFLDFFYHEMKESGNYDFPLEFIKNNFYVTGYCGCGEVGCGTVGLYCNRRVKRYQIDETPTKIQRDYFTHLHLSKNNKVIEFEYITIESFCAVYKNEVHSYIDKYLRLKKIVKKRVFKKI